LKRLLVYFIAFVVCSCGPNKKLKTANSYFDINGLIDLQVKMLDSISPVLFKKAIIDGKTENSEFTPNDSTWSREFMVFRSADINKPTLINRYNIIENKSNDGRKTIFYISKERSKTLVDSLSIVFFPGNQKPSKIHAILSHDNALFSNEKTLDIYFTPDGNLISSYKIQGWQKMISKDSSAYFVESTIKNL